MPTIYLATNNPFKVDEVKAIAAPFGFAIDAYSCDIRELQTVDRKQLIRQKTVEAFTRLRCPVLVDHASLEIESLKGMPGTLTQLFWDNLEGRICDIVAALGNSRARAVCTVGFCDGRTLYDDEGIVEGNISSAPIGARAFQWDTIFVPLSETRTYAEMTIVEKNAISQRKIAFEKLFHRIARV
jgi:XTP/dITP diphosphohydrolase